MLFIICDFNLGICSGAICTALSTARNRLECTGQQPLKEHDMGNDHTFCV